MSCRSSSGRCAPSRHPAESHPQVLIITLATIGLLQERAVKEHSVLAEQLQGALNSRVLIEQAKGVFAERHGVEVSMAFTAMRSHARNTGQPRSAVANQVIDGTFEASLVDEST